VDERCRKIRELLSGFLDGELNEAEQKLVEDHLIECPLCQKHLARLQDLDQIIKEIEVERPSHDFHLRLARRLKQEYDLRRPRPYLPFLNRLIPLAAAAAVIIIILLSTHLFFYHPAFKAKGLKPERRIGVTVELDSLGRVVSADLEHSTGSDSLDSLLLEKIRARKFPHLLEGGKGFPAQRRLYLPLPKDTQ